MVAQCEFKQIGAHNRTNRVFSNRGLIVVVSLKVVDINGTLRRTPRTLLAVPSTWRVGGRGARDDLLCA